MGLIQIYQCLCDETRLRILHLLKDGELCVCHFQEILEAPQVRISKHLAYLRERGLVESRREGAWKIYRLPVKPFPELDANLACLHDCVSENPVFRRDGRRRARLRIRNTASSPMCCAANNPKAKATAS